MEHRKLFNHLADPSQHKVEHGGAIDFKEDGKIEQIYVKPGTRQSVDLPVDFEVLYHTHLENVDLPSPEDMVSFIDTKKQQAELVFRGDQGYAIIKTPETKKLSQYSRRKLYSIFGKIWNDAGEKPDMDAAFQKSLEELGFKVKRTRPDEPIRLDGVRVYQ